MHKFVIYFTWFLMTVPSIGQTTKNIDSEKVKLECVYRLTYRPDSTNTKLLIDHMQLLVSDNFSEFRSFNRFSRDSIKRASIEKANASVGMSQAELNSSIANMLKVPSPKFNYVIYKTADKKQCMVYDKIVGQDYEYDEPEYPLKWVLTSTTDTFLGYTCRKATTLFAGRNYEAWFTKDIPVSDGPYKFSGLPGLIVKIKDLNNNYDFELVKVSKPNKLYNIDLPPQIPLKTTKNVFMQALRSTREHAFDRAAHYGVSFKDPEAVQQQIRENFKHANNPIELKY